MDRNFSMWIGVKPDPHAEIAWDGCGCKVNYDDP